MKFFSTIILLFTLVSFIHAQDPPHCGTDEYRDQLLQNNPDIARDYAISEATIKRVAQQLYTAFPWWCM